MPALNDVSVDKKEQIVSSVNALFEESVKASEKAKQEQAKLSEQLNELKTKKENVELKLQQASNDLKSAKEDAAKTALKHAQEIDLKQKAIDAQKAKVQERETEISGLNTALQLSKKTLDELNESSKNALKAARDKLQERIELARKQHEESIKQKEEQIKKLKQEHEDEMKTHASKVDALKKDIEQQRKMVAIAKSALKEAESNYVKADKAHKESEEKLKTLSDKNKEEIDAHNKTKAELKAVTERAQAAAENVLKVSGEKDKVKQELAQEKANYQKTKDALNGKIMGLENKLKEEREDHAKKQADWSKRMAELRKKAASEATQRAKNVREKKEVEIYNLKQAHENRLKNKEEELKEANRKLHECETKKPRKPPPLPSSIQPMMEAPPSYLFSKPVRRNKKYSNLRY